MTRSNPIRKRRSYTGAWLALALLAGVPLQSSGAPEEPVKPAVKEAPVKTEPTSVTIRVMRGKLSQLPYPEGADVWADARSDAAVSVPVNGRGTFRLDKVSVLVFQPAGQTLKWETLVALYTNHGLLPPSAEPKLEAKELPQGDLTVPAGVVNLYQSRVYRTITPGEHLVLGVIRNLRSQNMLVYAVQVSSKLGDGEILGPVKAVVDELAEKARLERERLEKQKGGEPRPRRMVVPPGSIATGPTLKLDGGRLRRMRDSLLRDASLTPQVRQALGTMLSRATEVRYSTYRTATQLPDQEVVDFYTKEGQKAGWGTPASTDTMPAGQVTMLFQPKRGGAVLVRGQATPSNPALKIPSPTTLLYLLEVDGNIDALQ